MNILWLMELRPGVACELLLGAREPDRRLDLIFDQVVRQPRPEESFRLEVADGTVDLLLPYELLSEVLASRAQASNTPSPVAVLRECRRVLRDGGALVFPFENRSWFRDLAGRSAPVVKAPDRLGAVGMARVKRALGKAGFRSTRFYLSPTRPDHPVSLIPCHTHAILADRQLAGRDGRLQRLGAMGLARAGLHAHLYRFAFAVSFK